MSAGHVTQKGTAETWDEPPISLWPVETFKVKGLQWNWDQLLQNKRFKMQECNSFKVKGLKCKTIAPSQ